MLAGWERDADESLLLFWSQPARVAHVPELARIAIFVHAIHPTEACVERAFSAQGRVQSDLRASLSLASVNAIMKVKINLTVLQK